MVHAYRYNISGSAAQILNTAAPVKTKTAKYVKKEASQGSGHNWQLFDYPDPSLEENRLVVTRKTYVVTNDGMVDGNFPNRTICLSMITKAFIQVYIHNV
jgi:hypothetical protein